MTPLLALALLGGAAPQAPATPTPLPARLVRYEIVESRHSLTPRGERDEALAGTVLVAGDRARWDLTSGVFPRSRATAALVHRDGLTLLDTKEGIAAEAGRGDFEALFVPKAAESPAASPVVRDLSVSVRSDGAGRTFEGMPTARWSVELRWSLVVTLPGGVNAIRHTTRGTIETVDLPEALSFFDGLSRLFAARGEAREALEAELRKVAGLPVAVSLSSEAEASGEPVAPAAAAGALERPFRTTTTIRRAVSKLERGRLRPEDEVRFTVPPGFKSRGLERLLQDGPGLP